MENEIINDIIEKYSYDKSPFVFETDEKRFRQWFPEAFESLSHFMSNWLEKEYARQKLELVDITSEQYLQAIRTGVFKYADVLTYDADGFVYDSLLYEGFINDVPTDDLESPSLIDVDKYNVDLSVLHYFHKKDDYQSLFQKIMGKYKEGYLPIELQDALKQLYTYYYLDALSRYIRYEIEQPAFKEWKDACPDALYDSFPFFCSSCSMYFDLYTKSETSGDRRTGYYEITLFDRKTERTESSWGKYFYDGSDSSTFCITEDDKCSRGIYREDIIAHSIVTIEKAWKDDICRERDFEISRNGDFEISRKAFDVERFILNCLVDRWRLSNILDQEKEKLDMYDMFLDDDYPMPF